MPDAGFFIDGPMYPTGELWFREQFIGADPVWNVTGSGGTDLGCLAGVPQAEQWRCLMAQYIAPYIDTPMFVLQSGYDCYQIPIPGGMECLPDCSADEMTAIQHWHDLIVHAVQAVYQGKPQNGLYLDSCYVHEQGLDACANNTMGCCVHDCVGWSPNSRGSKKWGWTVNITTPTGSQLTPQAAFHSWYYDGMVLAFERNVALEDDIGSHACLLEASITCMGPIECLSSVQCFLPLPL
jgi:hypothetical protein